MKTPIALLLLAASVVLETIARLPAAVLGRARQGIASALALTIVGAIAPTPVSAAPPKRLDVTDAQFIEKIASFLEEYGSTTESNDLRTLYNKGKSPKVLIAPIDAGTTAEWSPLWGTLTLKKDTKDGLKGYLRWDFQQIADVAQSVVHELEHRRQGGLVVNQSLKHTSPPARHEHGASHEAEADSWYRALDATQKWWEFADSKWNRTADPCDQLVPAKRLHALLVLWDTYHNDIKRFSRDTVRFARAEKNLSDQQAILAAMKREAAAIEASLAKSADPIAAKRLDQLNGIEIPRAEAAVTAAEKAISLYVPDPKSGINYWFERRDRTKVKGLVDHKLKEVRELEKRAAQAGCNEPIEPWVGQAAPAPSATASGPADAFWVIVPSIWQGVSDTHGFHVKRTLAKGGLTGEKCPHPAEAFGEVFGKVSPSSAPRSMDEIRSRLDEEKLAHEKYGRKVQIQPFAIGEFKGYFLEADLLYSKGGWSHSGYRGSAMEGSGHGWVLKNGKAFEVNYWIVAGGCWNDSQRSFQESQTRAAQAEARAIVAGLRLVEAPGISQIPYVGPKLDGSDLPVVATPAQPGSTPAPVAVPPSTSPAASPTPSIAPPATGAMPVGRIEPVFAINNSGGVRNGPTQPSTFSISSPYRLTKITTYHWNEGRGAPAGTIALRGADGRTVGPWQARAVNRVYWEATPNVVLAPGIYQIIDSDPSTWAQNSQSGGAGMAWAEGERLQAALPPAASPLAGQWRIVANGYPGSIEFTQTGGSWTGRENIDGAWEPIGSILFDPRTGTVEFTRPRVAQRYRGTLSGTAIKGTFDQGGAGRYVWEATH